MNEQNRMLSVRTHPLISNSISNQPLNGCGLLIFRLWQRYCSILFALYTVTILYFSDFKPFSQH